MNTKPKKPEPKKPPKDRPKGKSKDSVARVWPKHLKRPIPRYRIEDTNPGD